MARVKMDELVDHLSSEMKKALDDTLQKHFAGQSYDRNAFFRDFTRNVYRRCNVWENVPDQYVEAD